VGGGEGGEGNLPPDRSIDPLESEGGTGSKGGGPPIGVPFGKEPQRGFVRPVDPAPTEPGSKPPPHVIDLPPIPNQDRPRPSRPANPAPRLGVSTNHMARRSSSRGANPTPAMPSIALRALRSTPSTSKRASHVRAGATQATRRTPWRCCEARGSPDARKRGSKATDMREKKRSGIPSSASALELVPAKEQDEAKDALRKVVSTMDVADGSWDGEDEELEQEVRKQHVVSEVLFLSSIGATKRLTSVFEEDPQLIDCSDYDRRTPLHVAAGNGKTSVVRLLLAKGANPSPIDRWKNTPMHDAIKGDKPEVVALLQKYEGRVYLEGKYYNLNEYNQVLANTAGSPPNQVSKILFAASAGDLDSVMELVEQDVQLKDCADYDKRTPLHLACSEGQSHVAKWLLEQGTNPSPVDRWDGTPLKDALNRGHYDIVELLLAHKARLFDKGHFITLEEHNNKVAMRDIDWEIPRSQLEEMPAETRMMKSGTFGKVYTAKWKGTIVAVKELHEPRVASQDALATFRTELSVFSSIAHPNVVQFLGACTIDPPYCIIEEYMPGGSLRDLIAGARTMGQQVPLGKCLDIFIQSACGMSYLHNKRPCAVIHRDLKPDNILLDRGGTAKIADFGLSKSIMRPSNKSSQAFLNTRYRMTSAGSFCYMPPEIFLNEPYNFKVDVYSFAMVMYELFEGKVPFEDELQVWSFQELGNMVCKGVRPYMQRTPASVKRLISRMWDTDSEKRPDFRTIVEALSEVKSLDDLPGQSAPTKKTNKCCVIS